MPGNPGDSVPQAFLEQTVGCIVGLLRLLWRCPGANPADAASLFSGGTPPDLAEQLTRECPDAAAESSQAVAARWLSANNVDAPLTWTFPQLCQVLLPSSARADDVQYFAMTAIRRRYRVPFSPATARSINDLAAGMAALLAAYGRDIPYDAILDTLGILPRNSVSRQTQYDHNGEVFLEICLVLSLLDPTADREHIRVQQKCASPEYLLTHLFGVATGIPGFDDLFGGGGLILSDSVSTAGPPAGQSNITPSSIGGRTILCVGPFASGKSLLSLQIAVEIARKRGLALVIALEQNVEDCLDMLEAVGVSSRDDPLFKIWADKRVPAPRSPPPAGALVFLEPEEYDYDKLLRNIEKRLPWLSAHYPLRLLVVDPVSALNSKDVSSLRAATMRMLEAAKMANVNVWFTCELLSNEHGPIHFLENVTDTVIHLGFFDRDRQRRYVEITKSRFQSVHLGRHYLFIKRGGIHIHPSMPTR